MNVSEKFLRGLREPRLTWAAPGGNARHRLIGATQAAASSAADGMFCPGLAGTLRGNSTFIGIFVMARHLLD
jgi:hypothetical protein